MLSQLRNRTQISVTNEFKRLKILLSICGNNMSKYVHLTVSFYLVMEKWLSEKIYGRFIDRTGKYDKIGDIIRNST